MGKKKILIIDDEFNFCKLVKLNLELTGEFEVDVAQAGKRGLALAKKKRPDLILLDILMPSMSGFEVLENLKKDRDTLEIPVVMLTAKGDEESKVKVAQLYGEEYLVKPMQAQELRTKIKQILSRRGVR